MYVSMCVCMYVRVCVCVCMCRQLPSEGSHASCNFERHTATDGRESLYEARHDSEDLTSHERVDEEILRYFCVEGTRARDEGMADVCVCVCLSVCLSVCLWCVCVFIYM